jgi:hypothetical protein
MQDRQGRAEEGPRDRRAQLQGAHRRLRPRPGAAGEGAWPRREFIYWTDDGSVAALRYDNLKVTFLKQEAEGLKVWQQPFTVLRAPTLTNLRMDPFERAEQENAMGYQRWYMERMFAIAPAGAYVGQWLQSFRSFRRGRSPAASTSTA